MTDFSSLKQAQHSLDIPDIFKQVIPDIHEEMGIVPDDMSTTVIIEGSDPLEEIISESPEDKDYSKKEEEDSETSGKPSVVMDDIFNEDFFKNLRSSLDSCSCGLPLEDNSKDKKTDVKTEDSESVEVDSKESDLTSDNSDSETTIEVDDQGPVQGVSISKKSVKIKED